MFGCYLPRVCELFLKDKGLKLWNYSGTTSTGNWIFRWLLGSRFIYVCRLPQKSLREAGMAQWWERSPPTNVAPCSTPGPGVICELTLLLALVLARFFSGYSGFPLSSKTNFSKFQFDPEPEGHRFVSPRLLGVTLLKQSWFIFLFVYYLLRQFVRKLLSLKEFGLIKIRISKTGNLRIWTNQDTQLVIQPSKTSRKPLWWILIYANFQLLDWRIGALFLW